MLSAVRQPRVAWKLFLGLLGFVLLAGGAAAVQRVLSVLEAAKPPTPVLFDHGRTALDPQALASWTNHYCGSCHAREYEQWTQSRHFLAGINKNFRAQFLDPGGGRRQFCLNCHAPTNPGTDLLPTREPDGIEETFQSRPDWLAHGVDCLTCHVRDGQVLATHVSDQGEEAHPMRLAPELGSAEFCAGCHQFGNKQMEFPDVINGQLQQASLEEFLDYRTKGGTETRCHDCHMRDGDHVMPGGYDLPMLRNAIELDLSVKWRDDVRMVELTVEVSADNVGHRVPGGEHFFRSITIRTEVTVEGGKVVVHADQTPELDKILAGDVKLITTWPRVETIGHERGRFEQGQRSATPTKDTRLWPGEERRFHYLTAIDSQKTKTIVRVRSQIMYHILDEHAAKKFGFERNEITTLVHSAETSLELTAEQSKVQH